jgi:hypothetical protein
MVRLKATTLFTQTIDTDADGHWDKLLIEVSLAAKARETLQVYWVPETKLEKYPAMTNVRLSLKSKNGYPSPEIEKTRRLRGFEQNIAEPYYQLEGPSIENDKVAFRTFFDKRNGKDVYGKTTTSLVLDQVGLTGSWHQLNWWGMDILKTGNSLGAGSYAIAEKDKWYRLADADTSIFTALYEGPLQAAYEIKFANWDTGTLKSNGSETIVINKGDFYFQSILKLRLSKEQRLICGFPNFIGAKAEFNCLNDHLSSLSTFGAQADGSSSNLGMALIFPTVSYLSNGTTQADEPIPNTTFVELKPGIEQRLFFIAAWEKTNNDFATKAGFDSYLRQVALKLAHPIVIHSISP